MIPYVSRTGTRAQLAAFRSWRWRLLVSARGVLSDEGLPFALDNGAWTAHAQGTDFDDAAFLRALGWAGGREDWVVVPDVVGDAVSTLRKARAYLPLFEERAGRVPVVRPYLCVQDGMTRRDVLPFVGRVAGVFVGGSDDFKDRTMADWAAFAHDHGLRAHIGRVNTKHRLALCVEAGADSFDGSGAARFLKHAENIQRWLKEMEVVW